MNIAIVDDMTTECELLHNLLKQYENQQCQTIEIKEFHSGIELLYNYIPGSFDVVFMDIFLNNESGIDCAMKLRELDKNINIIFLTTSSEFGVKSYDVRATDYIVKPASLETLSRALSYCKIPELHNEAFITVTTKNQILKVELNRIIYADFQNRNTCLHLINCVIPISGSFSEISEKLTAYSQFMLCFKGIVVNFMHIQENYNDYLVLKNGERIPVSRRLQRQVKQKRLSLSANSLRGEII